VLEFDCKEFRKEQRTIVVLIIIIIITIISTKPETWGGGAGVNQAVGRQLAIAGLDKVGPSTSHNPTGLHSLLWG
jgi:hypothetical protein